MIVWLIQTTENGDLQPVTAQITAPSGAYAKQSVVTLNFTDPAVPNAVRSNINSQGLNCNTVMILNVTPSGSGTVTFSISSAESGMLSKNPSGNPNGVVAVFDQTNALCLAAVPTKGSIRTNLV